MSSHYTLTLNVKLKRDLTPTEIHFFNYAINGIGQAPDDLPEHDAFADGISSFTIHNSFCSAPAGSYLSQFWQGAGAFGMPADGGIDYGINLLLPSLTMEDALSYLPFARWLATRSHSIGYVGAITCEDDEVGMPLFWLFIYNNQLQIGTPEGEIILEPAQ